MYFRKAEISTIHRQLKVESSFSKMLMCTEMCALSLSQKVGSVMSDSYGARSGSA